MAGQPGIYLLCGEDEFTQDEFVAALTAQIGDAGMADLNSARLDGRIHSLEDLAQAASALPFLAERRLVIFSHPSERAKGPTQQKKLTDFLNRVPPTTLLVLTEDHLLTDERSRKKNRLHWLEKWALAAGERVVFKEFRLPIGAQLNAWIQRRAEKAGGRIKPLAADHLAGKVGPEPRLLDQEIGKLLAYVNYARPVEPEDVEAVTPFTARVPDFALMNALRSQNARQVFSLMHRELEEKDPLYLFGSIVAQFRQVLQARELLEQGGNKDDLAQILRIHPFAAEKALEHARRYSLTELEHIYHRLLEVDIAMKSSGMENELALDLLMVELTNASR